MFATGMTGTIFKPGVSRRNAVAVFIPVDNSTD
jgi:hypothetical protein